MPLTNNTNVPLYIAAYLAYDDYDYDNRPNCYSATTLIKNVRKTVLASRVNNYELDIMDVFKSRIGQATHAALEGIWSDPVKRNYALRVLGYSAEQIESIVINPETHDPSKIAVYVERRREREIDGYIIRGKFDFCAEGILRDLKTTTTFTYTKQNKLDDYRLQLSIYRWLNQDIITEDYAYIDYFFTDWKAGLAKSSKNNYPAQPHVEQKIKLLSLADTEDFIRTRIKEIKKYLNKEDRHIPLCSAVDLWQDPPSYKYYSKETNVKCQGTFDSYVEAYNMLNSKGIGVVKVVESKAKACKWCKASAICEQRKNLESMGLYDNED